MRRLPIAAALVAAMALCAVPVAAPAGVAAIGGPLPPCRLADVLTIPRDYASWSTTLVDWIFSVGKSYKPPDLVPVADAGLPGGGLIRKVAIADLRALANAARANGSPIADFVSYRSYSTQANLFNYYVNGYGEAAAITYAQRPGHSEHQLGLAIDFMAAGASGMLSGDSRAGKWMAANAWKYGWILSYPDGKQDIVCLHYEPWHYRYFGRQLAAQIHASGLTSREYLWSHFTMVDPVTGLPLSSDTAAASPSPDLASAGASPEATAPPSEPSLPDNPAATTPPTGGVGSSGPALPVLLAIAGLVAVVAVAAWRGGGRRRLRGG